MTDITVLWGIEPMPSSRPEDILVLWGEREPNRPIWKDLEQVGREWKECMKATRKWWAARGRPQSWWRERERRRLGDLYMLSIGWRIKDEFFVVDIKEAEDARSQDSAEDAGA